MAVSLVYRGEPAGRQRVDSVEAERRRRADNTDTAQIQRRDVLQTSWRRYWDRAQCLYSVFRMSPFWRCGDICGLKIDEISISTSIRYRFDTNSISTRWLISHWEGTQIRQNDVIFWSSSHSSKNVIKMFALTLSWRQMTSMWRYCRKCREDVMWRQNGVTIFGKRIHVSYYYLRESPRQDYCTQWQQDGESIGKARLNSQLML